MRVLNIAEGLELPAIESVTQTYAILAKRGKGKTYTASVFAEELIKSNAQVVIVDPIGVWWGLRSSADGKSAGLPILIVGGEHGDIPLEEKSGTVLADAVVDQKLSVVVDLSLLRKNAQVRFMTDFAETLYHRNRTALQLILDEADAFAPQRPGPEQFRLLGSIEDIVRRGRARGIGVTMITQRPSVLNKNVLTQIEVLIALGLTAPLDQKAVEEWVKTNAEAGQREEFMSSLPSLPVGTAWFWSPGWLNIFQKVQVRKRETLDSSFTPKAGEAALDASDAIKPQALTAEGIERLRESMAETVERIESDDPKVLKKRIVELERQLKDQAPKVEYRDVIPEDVRVCIGMVKNAYASMGEYVGLLDKYMDRHPDPAFEVSINDIKANGHNLSAKAARKYKDTKMIKAQYEETPDGGVQVRLSGDMKRADRAIMTVLAVKDRKISVIAAITGYVQSGGGFRTALKRLREQGYVANSSDGLTLTAAGKKALGKDYEPDLPSSWLQTVNMWLKDFSGAKHAILEVVADNHPTPIETEHVAKITNYQSTGGGFRTAVKQLKSAGIIEGGKELQLGEGFRDV